MSRIEEERDFLLGSLRDLEAEHDAGDIDDVDYVTLKNDYTGRAATVLREIKDDSSAKAEAAAAPLPPSRRWRTAAVVAGILVFGALAGWAVSAASGSRPPGQTVSGNGQIASAGLDPRLLHAGKLVAEGKITDALKLYDQILKDNPEQPVALANEGWLIGQAAMAANRPDLVDEALTKINAAEKIDPNYASPHFFRGVLLLRAKNDAPGAVTELRSYLGLVDPSSPEVPQVEQILQAAITAAGPNVPPAPNAARP